MSAGPAVRAAIAVALALMAAGCGGGPAPAPAPGDPPAAGAVPAETPVDPATPESTAPADPVELGPEDVLEAWISAQEAGDFGWAQSYLVESHHDDWDQVAEQMSTDDLISAGLGFREDGYQLDFQDHKLAVFWSPTARLYLVMTREHGRWRVDPRNTDQMNGG